MDDPNEENVEDNWVILNPVDVAEEAISLDSEDMIDTVSKEKHDKASLWLEKAPEKKVLLDFDNDDSVKKNIESDSDSDGISIISESSQLHETTDEEIIEKHFNRLDEPQQKEHIKDVSFIIIVMFK